MPRYRAGENLPCFCAVTAPDWIPVFIESRYVEPLLESLKFCRETKGLQLFAFLVMPNHLHLIAAADDLHAMMRDYKRFTSRTIHERLMADGRETILTWLDRAAQRARRSRGEFSFWRDGFHPQAIASAAVLGQKMHYLHENPVRKGLVVQLRGVPCRASAVLHADGCAGVVRPGSREGIPAKVGASKDSRTSPRRS